MTEPTDGARFSAGEALLGLALFGAPAAYLVAWLLLANGFGADTAPKAWTAAALASGVALAAVALKRRTVLAPGLSFVAVTAAVIVANNLYD